MVSSDLKLHLVLPIYVVTRTILELIDFTSYNSVPTEPRCKKNGLRVFRPAPTQTRLYSHRRWLEAGNFGFRKKRDCTICGEKTKALISCTDTAQLICVFVFAYAKRRFSHDAAHNIKHAPEARQFQISMAISFCF